MNPDIIGIGLATMDRLYLLADVSQLPHGKMLDYSVQGGGMAATAMAAASALGASCGMVTCVGDDEVGREILAGFEECNVDTSHIIVKPGTSSAVVMVLVDARSGDRSFLSLQDDHPVMTTDDINWEYVSGARIVHVDGWVTDMKAVLAKTRSLGATITVDSDVIAGLEPDWLSLVDVFIGSADVRRSPGSPDAALKEAERIAERGPHTAILTLGAQGCVGVGPEGTFQVPGLEVDVVDTTGAGDVFHGAYGYGLVREWKAEDCARFAGAAAALSTTKLGGRAGLAGASQAAALLRTHSQTGPWEG